MSQIRLSVIVPVFRVEKYLDTCVMSLLHQDLNADEYEIILVDDGSDDSCPKKCDEYAAQYKQIHAIHQPNKGLSGARNTGIKAARGKYICFVDSDDYVEPNTYSSLVRQAQNEQLDALVFRLQLVCGEKQQPIDTFTGDVQSACTGEEFINRHLSVRCFSVIYLIRRELLLENNLFFKEGIFYEDVEWLPRFLCSAKRVMTSNTMVYNYVQYANSITHPTTQERWKRLIADNMTVLRLNTALLQKVPNPAWLNAMNASIITSILTIVSKQFYSERQSYIASIREIYPYPLQGKANFPFAENIKIRIARFSPQLYCLIRHYL
jgi:glycosyltransferase involved in cell wall biosynthesis